jgi:2-succinyl-5-enolpyruvyl-6-hydroxy-3-cyclohexene-1-carboxylate synthase/o-succinylbenzoate synthase
MRQAVATLRLAADENGEDGSPLLRLEQRIHTSTTDPLAWLDWQIHYLPTKCDSPMEDAPLMYFGNQEGTTEAAVLGSLAVTHDTADIWELPLPLATRWYGGEAFDGTQGRSQEWEAYGAAWWILPAVEIKRDHEVTTLSVHVQADALAYLQDLLQAIDHQQSERRSPTTLPPILSRDGRLQSARGQVQDSQDLYEQAVSAALPLLSDDQCDLQKVVLARSQHLHFGTELCAGSLLKRWKYGGHEGGHLFWMRPSAGPDFCGCSPERLFRVANATVSTEALAGTRPRGSTAAADAQLCQDLFDSPKDMVENQLTGDFILETLQTLQDRGQVQLPIDRSSVFVRRLRHLQHICHAYTADIVRAEAVQEVTRYLLEHLHPTPAVCGVPTDQARQFIYEYESRGFDRGFYAGPVGYLGQQESDLVVAIRSGLIHQHEEAESGTKSTMTLYAGAGIVPGSTVKGEWAETNYKLAVVASLFPQSPFSLQGSLTPNVAWASAFVEELIRNGVTQFYICPGSRSTPLVVAISRALRSHLGIVHADSVHDERAAAFRALGYARGAGKPAAVITSSGTAVANLYPAVVEASMDGLPMLLLTADRPYESRSTGANQAIDQVNIFSSSYVRWFRDIPPPSDEVPISLVLSDVDHAVDVSKRARGPVHLNIQFRENLAPDDGKVRNDDRVDATTKFNAGHFTATSKYQRWSITGDRFTRLLGPSGDASVHEIARLIESSKRGAIVVGNVRPSTTTNGEESTLCIMDAIAEFAEYIGFPILAGVQSAALRYRSPAVVPFAEHLLRSPLVRDNIKPDLVIQIGAPLVSTEIPQAIKLSIGQDKEAHHVLVHPHTPSERFDPDFTVTHKVSADILPFLSSLQDEVHSPPSSELANLIPLGRRLQSEIQQIVQDSAQAAADDGEPALTEPELLLSLSESMEKAGPHALFLSNSMPIRDAEAFLYPLSPPQKNAVALVAVGASRGASGIDGIISTAKGFSESHQVPTTLLIGDVSTMHDVSSFHALANDVQSIRKNPGKQVYPLTTIVVNNDGGGIFSFLPIASHGNDVSFDEFFGTPTNSFDFMKGADSFGVPCQRSSDLSDFVTQYAEASKGNHHSMIEACVAKRDRNVRVHREISSRTSQLLENLLKDTGMASSKSARLQSRLYSTAKSEDSGEQVPQRTLLMLHGWMGDRSEWDETARYLADKLSPEWNLISLDLPGHGDSLTERSSEVQAIRRSLGLVDKSNEGDLSIEGLARSALSSLSLYESVDKIDAIAGYSLGGRVALAIKDLCASGEFPGMIRNTTKFVMLSAAPRIVQNSGVVLLPEERERLSLDDTMAEEILRISRSALTNGISIEDSHLLWSNFIDRWYAASLWGGLNKRLEYDSTKLRRCQSLCRRADDLAAILSQCSPPRNKISAASVASNRNSLFVAGKADEKYSKIGEALHRENGVSAKFVPDCGHALLVEAPLAVADIIANFVMTTNATDSSSESAEFPRRKVLDDSDVDNRLAEQTSQELNDMAGKSSALQFVSFSIELVDQARSPTFKSGIGWGDRAKASSTITTRRGVIIELSSDDRLGVSLGEAAPLKGVHEESLEAASDKIEGIRQRLSQGNLTIPDMEANRLLKVDGSLSRYLTEMFKDVEGFSELRSVYTAFEMALLGLASQKTGLPVLQAMARSRRIPTDLLQTTVQLNGLLLRLPEGSLRTERLAPDGTSFDSLKVKVGHQDPAKDLQALSHVFEWADYRRGRGGIKVRLDANRAWNESRAIGFASSIEGLDARAFDRIEFVEEPLVQLSEDDFPGQVEALERFYRRTGLVYALDESLADLAADCQYDFVPIRDILRATFETSRGCAALVLKPTLLGFELSMQLATLARTELAIGAVFSSCFDSGVGLAYTSFLAGISDSLDSKATLYAHGLGTFEMLSHDTLNPPFSSHVDQQGLLNVASLSRSMYGLSLTELQQSVDQPPRPGTLPASEAGMVGSSNFDASSSPSTAEISFSVSLDLPFSSEIAHARFTDLPQQPRWSPWLTSVAYQEGTQETEWKLNVRGIPLQWRAKSQVLHEPWPAIQWESVSGLSNGGIVEFITTDENSCEMRVRLSTRPPRVLRPLFRGASIFLEDFIRDKLLKWSLEMFRDVVKADLALERGDVELGDALFGAVAGKAVAIEATLNSRPTARQRPPDNSVDE